MTTGNMHRKIGKFRPDMLADRQTDTQTDRTQYSGNLLAAE